MKTLKLITFIILVYGLFVQIYAQNTTELDKYGGWTNIKFESTGFFRVEKTDQRYWFVTPEGNAFITNGINHADFNWLSRFYNKEFWEYHFKNTYHCEDEFKMCFIHKAKEDIKILGMNTLGIHNWIPYYSESFMPYVFRVRFVENHHYNKNHTKEVFVDVFSDEFVKFCDKKAEEMVSSRKDDPYLLGYALTDCPILTDYEAQPHGNNIYGWKRGATPTWPQVLRNLGAKDPGKKEYVKKMKTLYKDDIKSFNKTYNTSFNSFEELFKKENWRDTMDMNNEMEIRDNLEFLYVVVDKCYEVEAAAIRKYDANHMIFGDKLNGNTNTPDEIYAIAGKHFDVINIQYYALWDDLNVLLDRISKVTDKPIIMGDASINVPSKNMTNPFGPHCKDQMERVEKFKELYYNAFKLPNFLGWNWCGYMDSYDIGGQHGKQHGGLQDPLGNWHPIKDAMKEFSDNLYQIVTSE